MENILSTAYSNIIENMTDGVFLIGHDGKVVLENSVAIGLLGCELHGRRLIELIGEGGVNDQFYQCIIEAIFQKSKIYDSVPFVSGDEKKFLRIAAFPITDETGTSVMVMFSDVTEIVSLAEKNRILSERLADFLQRFVKIMVSSIDKRSHYNATHTRKMASYATRYLEYLDKVGRPIDPDKKEPLLSSVWLHDIGKLVIPLEIMDKPSRLGDKEEDIKHKIEVAQLCYRIKSYEEPGNAAEYERVSKELKEIEDFIMKVNSRGFLDDETLAKIEAISEMKCLAANDEMVPLLDDYEKEALMIRKGTLTASERSVIESHVSQTYEMLKEMDLEGDFKDVPEWAGNHHELLDGSGYPRGLKGDEISWETRLLTIIDIYDALTAEDRPYKPPMPPEKAFAILESMKNEGKIDGEILKDFYESKAWVVE